MLKTSTNPQPFLFCAALNNQIGLELPEYIQQRILPRILLEGPDIDELIEIARMNFNPEPSKALIERFRAWGSERPDQTISARQALTLFRLATRIRSAGSVGDLSVKNDDDAFELALQAVFPREAESWPRLPNLMDRKENAK